MNIYLDIETIPTQRKDVFERITSSIEAPGSYKKPESREKWLLEHGPEATDKAWHKTALDGTFGEIVCISWAIDDGEVQSSYRPHRQVGGERSCIARFFAELVDIIPSGESTLPVWIGHNISRFDLRFIWQRSVILGLKPPIYLPVHTPPWTRGAAVFDTMYQWVGRDFCSLERLCEGLGIHFPDTIKGKDVWDCWRNGNYQAIVQHCESDVRSVRAVDQALHYRRPPE